MDHWKWQLYLLNLSVFYLYLFTFRIAKDDFDLSAFLAILPFE